MKKYTLVIEGRDTAEYSKKTDAVKNGEKSGEDFKVFSPSGILVHEASAAPVEEAPAPSPTEEPETVEEAPEPSDETVEEELPQAGSTKFDIEAMKRKISGLLAKAEATDNEAERDAFDAKAQQLMIRLGIHAAELEAGGVVKPEEIVEQDVRFDNRFCDLFVRLAQNAANGIGHLTILQTIPRRGNYRLVHVIGHKSDVEQFIVLLHSLHLQSLSAVKRFQKENAESRKGMTKWERFSQDRAFIVGFGITVGKRLADLRETEEEIATPGAALVLVGKDDRVNDWVGEQYPDLKKTRGSQINDMEGLVAGMTAGKTANIGQKGVGTGVSGELA